MKTKQPRSLDEIDRNIADQRTKLFQAEVTSNEPGAEICRRNIDALLDERNELEHPR